VKRPLIHSRAGKLAAGTVALRWGGMQVLASGAAPIFIVEAPGLDDQPADQQVAQNLAERDNLESQGEKRQRYDSKIATPRLSVAGRALREPFCLKTPRCPRAGNE